VSARHGTTIASGREMRAHMASLVAFAVVALASTRALAQSLQPDRESAFTFRTRALVTGSSDHSDPPGYKVYSTFPLEAGLGWSFHRLFALEIDARTESHEVDVASASGPDTRLGSIELLPIYALAQVRPWAGTLRPYAGLGANLTVVWEKSGLLDDTRIPPAIGPAVQLGLDIVLSRVVVLNFDARWNVLRLHLEGGTAPPATLRIDPLSLGVGLGFRI
jgi:outer membrane protein